MALYAAAFAVMLLLSYSVDSRKKKAALPRRPTKLDVYKANATGIAANEPTVQGNGTAMGSGGAIITTSGGTGHVPDHDEGHDRAENRTAAAPGSSDDTLNEEVRSLIEQVDSEQRANKSVAAEPGGAATPVKAAGGEAAQKRTTAVVEPVAGTSEEEGSASSVSPAEASVPGDVSSEQDSIREQFVQAAENLKAFKSVMNDVSIRNMEAMALQVQHGDCEKTADGDERQSLFKSESDSDAEEVDRTSALWGAWCSLKGQDMYSVMRSYVEHADMFEQKAMESKEASDDASSPVTLVSSTTANRTAEASSSSTESDSGDSAAHTPPQRMTPDRIRALLDDDKEIVDANARLLRLESIIDEHEFRLMQALYTQAFLGNCELYASAKVEVGSLVVRHDSPLWGAWCLLEDRPREAARTNYLERERFFEEQNLKRENEEISLGGEGDKDSGVSSRRRLLASFSHLLDV